MRMLIRIVFVIFIANVIDCLGRVCDDCCDCFKEKKNEEKKNEEKKNEEKKNEEKKNEEKKNEEKKNEEIEEYEEIKEDEENTAKSLVNNKWFNAKENKPVLKIFKKKDNNEDNEDKILIKLDKDNNPKIAYQKGPANKLNLGEKKYAFFEIKKQEGENTVYLYCSDVESSRDENNENGVYGIFEGTKHKSISVIACDTEKVTNMGGMFFWCSSLTELNLKNFNTTNVTNMAYMYSLCNNLTKIDLNNFNTKNVTNMAYMFSGCSSLEKLNLKNFDTTKVTCMHSMFKGCSSLEILEFVENFKTEKNLDINDIFVGCINLPEETQNKFLNKKKYPQNKLLEKI